MLDWSSTRVLPLFLRFVAGRVLNSSPINPSDDSNSRLTDGIPMWMRKVEAEFDEFGPAAEPALVCSEAAFAQAFHYWRGASGRRYLHSVYSLIGCPALPRANYILVRRY